MALLYITEHVAGSYAGMQTVKWPPAVRQAPLTIGGGPVQSAAFGGDTKIIRVHCDSACLISVGSAPDATVDGTRFAPNQTEYLDVPPGQKLSVVSTA